MNILYNTILVNYCLYRYINLNIYGFLKKDVFCVACSQLTHKMTKFKKGL